MFSHASAPVRIGIAGGGTDLPAWTRERTGHCLSLAIATYTHAVAISRPDGKVVASYRQRDEAMWVTEIANGLIRETARMQGFKDSFEVHTLSELSSQGSGLGVSSSIAVALTACFHRLRTLMDSRGELGDTVIVDGHAYRHDVAAHAWTVEIDRLERSIGRQDHMAAAYGGLRLYAFQGADAQVERTFTQEDACWAAKHLVLLTLPQGHDARAILSGVKSTDQLAAAAAAVEVAVQAIEKRDLGALGEALGMGQASKRSIPGATPPEVENAVDAARRVRGVYGCKVTGAGGGGHLVVACDPEAHEELRRMTRLPLMPPVAADFHGVRSEGSA